MKLKFLPESKLKPQTELHRYMSLTSFLLLAKGKIFVPSMAHLGKSEPKEMFVRRDSVRPALDPDPLLQSEEFRELRAWLFRFTEDQLQECLSLVSKLRRGSDPLSAYLWSKFSADGKGSIETSRKYDSYKRALTEELNKLIRGPSIYEPERFRHVALSDEAQSLVRTEVQGAEMVRLNRILLEDSYELEIKRLHSCRSPRFENSCLVDAWLDNLATRRFAWCWFEPEGSGATHWIENMAMWNLYAQTGIAIATTLSQIEASLQKTTLNELIVSEMQYCAQGLNDPRFHKPDYAHRPFFFKSTIYAHEREVRLVFQDKPSFESGVVIDIDPKVLLKNGTVVTSPHVFFDEANALMEILKGLLGRYVMVRLSPGLSRDSGDPRSRRTYEEIVAKALPEEPDLPTLLREL